MDIINERSNILDYIAELRRIRNELFLLMGEYMNSSVAQKDFVKILMDIDQIIKKVSRLSRVPTPYYIGKSNDNCIFNFTIDHSNDIPSIYYIIYSLKKKKLYILKKNVEDLPNYDMTIYGKEKKSIERKSFKGILEDESFDFLRLGILQKSNIETEMKRLSLMLSE